MTSSQLTNKLNPRQTLFIAEYLVDGNAGPAAIRAGYKDESMGRHNLAHPTISARIEERMAEKVDRIAERQAAEEERLAASGLVTVPWVLGLLHSVASRCNEPEHYQPQHVLRAAELAGKYLSIWVDRVDVQAAVTFNIALGVPSYFDDQAGGEQIEGEVIEHDEGTRETGGPNGELRHDAGSGGQGAEVGDISGEVAQLAGAVHKGS